MSNTQEVRNQLKEIIEEALLEKDEDLHYKVTLEAIDKILAIRELEIKA